MRVRSRRGADDLWPGYTGVRIESAQGVGAEDRIAIREMQDAVIMRVTRGVQSDGAAGQGDLSQPLKSLSPAIPIMTPARLSSRAGVALSPKASMPVRATPMAPMPTHTA